MWKMPKGRGKIWGRVGLGVVTRLRDTEGMNAIPQPVRVSVAEYLATSYGRIATTWMERLRKEIWARKSAQSCEAR